VKRASSQRQDKRPIIRNNKKTPKENKVKGNTSKEENKRDFGRKSNEKSGSQKGGKKSLGVQWSGEPH
jgi:hypothetical protein